MSDDKELEEEQTTENQTPPPPPEEEEVNLRAFAPAIVGSKPETKEENTEEDSQSPEELSEWDLALKKLDEEDEAKKKRKRGSKQEEEEETSQDVGFWGKFVAYERTQGWAAAAEYSAYRWARDKIKYSDSDYEGVFDLDKEFKNSGLSEDDRALFDGTETYAEFMHKVASIKQERDDARMLENTGKLTYASIYALDIGLTVGSFFVRWPWKLATWGIKGLRALVEATPVIGSTTKALTKALKPSAVKIGEKLVNAANEITKSETAQAIIKRIYPRKEAFTFVDRLIKNGKTADFVKSTLASGVRGAEQGALYGTSLYASQYTVQDAKIIRDSALFGGLVGAAFPFVGTAFTTTGKKMADLGKQLSEYVPETALWQWTSKNICTPIANRYNKTIGKPINKFVTTPISKGSKWAVNKLMTDFSPTRTPAYEALAETAESKGRVERELDVPPGFEELAETRNATPFFHNFILQVVNFNKDMVPGARGRNSVEAEVRYFSAKKMGEYAELMKELDPLNAEITAKTGMTAGQYIDYAYTKKGLLDSEPFAQRINPMVQKMLKDFQEVATEQASVKGRMPQMKNNLLPADSVENFNESKNYTRLREKYLDPNRSETLDVGYAPRDYDPNAVVKGEEEFKAMGKASAINEYTEHLMSKAVKQYEESGIPREEWDRLLDLEVQEKAARFSKKLVYDTTLESYIELPTSLGQQIFENISLQTKNGKRGISRGRYARDMRVEESALMGFKGKFAPATLVKFLTAGKREALLIKAAQDAGYNAMNQVTKFQLKAKQAAMGNRGKKLNLQEKEDLQNKYVNAFLSEDKHPLEAARELAKAEVHTLYAQELNELNSKLKLGGKFKLESRINEALNIWDIEDFIAEAEGVIDTKQAKELLKLRKEEARAMNRIDKFFDIIENKDNPGSFGMGVSPKVQAVKNFMYAATMGKLGLSSIGDSKVLAYRYGIPGIVDHYTYGFERFLLRLQKIMGYDNPEYKDVLSALRITATDMVEKYTIEKGLRNESWVPPSGTLQKISSDMADETVRWGAGLFFESWLRKSAARLRIKEIMKNDALLAELKTTREELSWMLENGMIPEEIERDIFTEVNQMASYPGLADYPTWTYSPLGQWFSTFKTWSFANSNQFLYPILKNIGSPSRQHLVASLFWLTALQSLRVRIEIELADEKEAKRLREHFWSEVLSKIWGDAGGNAELATSFGCDIARYGARGQWGQILQNQAPVLNKAAQTVRSLTTLARAYAPEEIVDFIPPYLNYQYGHPAVKKPSKKSVQRAWKNTLGALPGANIVWGAGTSLRDYISQDLATSWEKNQKIQEEEIEDY